MTNYHIGRHLLDPCDPVLAIPYRCIAHVFFKLGYSPKIFYFIVSKMICHQKYFEIINGTTTKIYGFILEFHNTKFYVILLIIYVIK
jgi:hypothetical protein